jgi:DNA-binding CsgD family transcriptional regulator
MRDTGHFSELVAGIYDAALDPDAWTPVLGRIRDFVGGSSAGIVTKDTAASRGAVCFDDGAIDPEFTTLYFDRYVSLDPCTTGHFFSSVDRPVSTTDIIPRDEFVETRFYREWAKPQGFIDYIGAAIDRSATTATVFNIIRRKGDGFFDDAARHRVTLVAGHLRRAMAVGSEFIQKSVAADSLADALDTLGTAIMLVGEDGALVHANAAATGLLAQTDILRKSGGKLIARKAEASHGLNALIAAAREGGVDIDPRAGAISLPTAGGNPYVAHVLPLTAGKRRRAGQKHDAVAAVFVREARLGLTAPPEAIARQYGLTPTELRVLLAIVDIGGVPEVADALGIAETTVKTHLARLFQKTGSTRQADLVKLFARFASPLRN